MAINLRLLIRRDGQPDFSVGLLPMNTDMSFVVSAEKPNGSLTEVVRLKVNDKDPAGGGLVEVNWRWSERCDK